MCESDLCLGMRKKISSCLVISCLNPVCILVYKNRGKLSYFYLFCVLAWKKKERSGRLSYFVSISGFRFSRKKTHSCLYSVCALFDSMGNRLDELIHVYIWCAFCYGHNGLFLCFVLCSVVPEGLVIALLFTWWLISGLCHLYGKGQSIHCKSIVWWLFLQRRCHPTPTHQCIPGIPVVSFSYTGNTIYVKRKKLLYLSIQFTLYC